MNRIHITNSFLIASSLMLLAFLFNAYGAFAQTPQLFLKFIEKQNKVQSGYVKLQCLYMTDNDTTGIEVQEGFFISTPQDLKYLTYIQKTSGMNIHCKSAHTVMMLFTWKDLPEYIKYRAFDCSDAKYDINTWNDLSYSTAHGFSLETLERWKKCTFQRISPKINEKNIRYKIVHPDDEINSNRSDEWEFDRKTLSYIQGEGSAIYLGTEREYYRTDILEQRLYDYVHPDILDTISFKFEEMKKGYDRQCAVEQAERDSVFRDSIASLGTHNIDAWMQKAQEEKDTVFFMPDWKYPSLSGDTICSDNIKSRFLFVDLWYISCHPCRMAMRELVSIDTLYDESLLKIISINVFDKDTVKMSQVVKNLNLQSDVACAYNNESIFTMSKKMGESRQGYPQLYLIDMETRQVIWYSYGWQEGFAKDIKEMIKDKMQNSKEGIVQK